MDAYREKQLMDRIAALEEKLDQLLNPPQSHTTTTTNAWPNYTWNYTQVGTTPYTHTFSGLNS